MSFKSKEVDEVSKELLDKNTKLYIHKMCKTCRFYDTRCTKNRVIRVCVEKGLKNRE